MVELLNQKVTAQPFIPLIGASGSGKSSVVFAGLTPALRSTGNWLIANCRPKNQPFYEMASSLIPFLYNDELERIKKTKQCAADLFTGELTLPELIDHIVKKNDNKCFLLIVDQFEELYTLTSDKTIQQRFIDRLIDSTKDKSFTVLLTMRADFMPQGISYSVFAESLNTYPPIIITPINETGLKEAIEQPALIQNVSFEPGLTELILKDLGNEPGNLPLLEFCLTQLWEKQSYRRLTHDAYKAIGGVNQALAGYAEAVFKEFTEHEKQRLRIIFLKLVRPGQGAEDTRQVATMEQIKPENRDLITKLADKRLIVTGQDKEKKQETIEVVHEALIRSWQTLRQWVDEDREFLTWHEKFKVLFEEWEKDNESVITGRQLIEAEEWLNKKHDYLTEKEQKFINHSLQVHKTKLRIKRISIVSVVVAVIAIAVVFGFLWNRTEEQRKVADKQRKIADAKTIEAEKEKIKADEQRKHAEKQTLRAHYNRAKYFEKEALSALKIADEIGDVSAYKNAVLFAFAAMEQEIEKDKYALKPDSIRSLFNPKVFNTALSERWTSHAVNLHQERVNSVSFSPDGKMLASASWDNTVRLWDSETGKQIAVLKGHTDSVYSVSFSPDGKMLASASWDNTVRLWDIRPYILFLEHLKPTPLYTTFMEGVKFLWHVKLQGLEYVPDYTPTLIAQDGYNFIYDKKFRPLLNPPAKGQSKFDQALHWAEEQQKK